MKTIKEITREEVRDLFDSIIFFRGEEYFDDGFVTAIEQLNSTTITGIVRGTQSYNVSVSIDEEMDLSCDCSCPCDFNCKHAAALLLEWLSVKDNGNFFLKESSLEPKQSLIQVLTAKSKEDLIELLQTVIEKHPQLKSLIYIERKAIILQIKKLFSEYWEWNEVSDLITQLETILDGVRRNKSAWDKEFLEEMRTCSEIMIKNVDNVHDEGDLGLFLEEWFETYGEVFSATKPTKEEKNAFVKSILYWIKNDDYGLDGSYEQAFVGFCTDKNDIELVKDCLKNIKRIDQDNDEDYEELYLKMYEKAGLDQEYLETAIEGGFMVEVVNKFISLGRLEEALEACKKGEKEQFSLELDDKKIHILRKLGRKNELKKILLALVKKYDMLNYALQLKQESSSEEWKKYCLDIIKHAKSKNKNSLLSRLYYHENDFKNAYVYSQDLNDANYLELLAKKLIENYPKFACEVFNKLCFYFINQGSGWPYQKAGKMLEAIKKIDKNGQHFRKTKEDIIKAHKKKYSLMAIIEKV